YLSYYNMKTIYLPLFHKVNFTLFLVLFQHFFQSVFQLCVSSSFMVKPHIRNIKRCSECVGTFVRRRVDITSPEQFLLFLCTSKRGYYKEILPGFLHKTSGNIVQHFFAFWN